MKDIEQVHIQRYLTIEIQHAVRNALVVFRLFFCPNAVKFGLSFII